MLFEIDEAKKTADTLVKGLGEKRALIALLYDIDKRITALDQKYDELFSRYGAISKVVSNIDARLDKARQYVGILTCGIVLIGLSWIVLTRSELFLLLIFPMVSSAFAIGMLFYNVTRLEPYAEESSKGPH